MFSIALSYTRSTATVRNIGDMIGSGETEAFLSKSLLDRKALITVNRNLYLNDFGV